MYNEKPSNTEHDKFYTWPVVNATNNKGLDKVVEKLELIYKSIDWPFKDPVQEVNLFQSGKSRSDHPMILKPRSGPHLIFQSDSLPVPS